MKPKLRVILSTCHISDMYIPDHRALASIVEIVLGNSITDVVEGAVGSGELIAVSIDQDGCLQQLVFYNT